MELYLSIHNEMSYYFAQQVLIDLFLLGNITLEEYQKITLINQQIFKPFMYEIMS